MKSHDNLVDAALTIRIICYHLLKTDNHEQLNRSVQPPCGRGYGEVGLIPLKLQTSTKKQQQWHSLLNNQCHDPPNAHPVPRPHWNLPL